MASGLFMLPKKGAMMCKRVFHSPIVFVVFFLAAGARELSAWGKTWMGLALRQVVSSAKWKFGPLRIDPVFYLRDAGYDTNLYYGSRGDPVKDYTVTLGPGFSVYLPLKKKVILQIIESPQYVYCHETKKERAWNNYLDARVQFALNKVFLSIGGKLTSARQRWGTEVDIRPRRREETYDGALLWQATRKTSFFIQGSRTLYDYENLEFDVFNLRDRLNRREDRLSFRSYYQLSPRARLFIEGAYGSFTFRNEVARTKDSRSYDFSGGLEFAPLGVVRGQVRLGYKIFEPLERTRTRFRGLAGDSWLSVRLLRFLTVRTSYSRNVQFSVWYDNAYYVESRTGGGASLYLFKTIRLDYDYGAGRNRYPESQVLTPGTQVKRRDNYSVNSVGLYFRLKKNIGVGLIASRWNRDSNLAWEIDDRDFIGLNLTYDF